MIGAPPWCFIHRIPLLPYGLGFHQHRSCTGSAIRGIQLGIDCPHGGAGRCSADVGVVYLEREVRVAQGRRIDRCYPLHILDANDLLPPGTLTFTGSEFYLVNPSAEDKVADVRVSSTDFPTEESIALYLDTELFDRWVVTDTSGLVKGAVIDPISRTIVITSPADAAVYGLPLQAGEVSTATLALHAPPTSTLAVRVSEQIDGEEMLQL